MKASSIHRIAQAVSFYLLFPIFGSLQAVPTINEVVSTHPAATGVSAGFRAAIEIYSGDTPIAANQYHVVVIGGDEGRNSNVGAIIMAYPLPAMAANEFYCMSTRNIGSGTRTILIVEGYTGPISSNISLDPILNVCNPACRYIADMIPVTTPGAQLSYTLPGILTGSLPWSNTVDGLAIWDGGKNDITFESTPATGISSTTVRLNPNFDNFNVWVQGCSRRDNGLDTNDAADWIRNSPNGAGLGAPYGNLPELNPSLTTLATICKDNLDVPVVCPANLTVCPNEPPFPLTGAFPAGGNYSGPGVSGGNFDASVAGLGTHTITYTRNLSSCSFTITVQDVMPPTITTCPSNQTVNTDPSQCSYTVNGTSWNATATDNCGIASLTYTLSGATSGTGSNLNGVSLNKGTTTVTWTATDIVGFTATCSFSVTVTDNQAPTATCPANQFVAANTGLCTYTHTSNSWDVIGADNCAVASIAYTLSGATTGNGSTLLGVAFNPGVTTVLWTVTDTAGLTANCTFTVTVADTQVPSINCVGDQTVNTSSGLCTYTNSGLAWDPLVSDNCGVAAVSYVLTGVTTGTGTSLNGVVFQAGITTVTWTVTDIHSLTNSCSFNVTVVDDQDPVLTCPPNQTVAADPGSCDYTKIGTSWDATGTDNCGVQAISYTLSGATTGTGTSLNGVAFLTGTTTVNWTITDVSGRTTNCSFTVTVQDTQNPTVSCVGNQSVNPTLGCTYTHADASWDPIGIDNCGISTIQYTLSGATSGTGTTLNGVTFQPGTTTVTWTITDTSGLTTVCSFQVSLIDNVDPVASCVADQTVTADPGVCTYTHSGSAWDATGTDNCGIATINYVLTGATTGSGVTLDTVVFQQGITTVTWTVTDAASRTSTCSFTVTVADNQNPTALCPANQVAITDPGTCTYSHSGTSWDVVAADNCSVASVSYSLAGATSGTGTTLNGVTFNLGVTTVTWTVMDSSGLTTTCNFTVTINDGENPVAICGPNRNVTADSASCTYTHTGNAWDAMGTDNCGVAFLSYSLSGATSGVGASLAGVTFGPGVTTVTWTVTDQAGLTGTCSYTVTVLDNQPPSISCAASQSVAADAGLCSYTHTGTAWDAVGSDNCGVATISYVLSGATSGTGTTLNGVTFQQGVTTVTWTITDNSTLTANCSFTVTVTDTQPPSAVVCPGNQSVNTDIGSCFYTHLGTGWDVVPADNCAIASVSYTLTGATTGSGSTLNNVVFGVGLTNVQWTVTDTSGLTTVCSYTVTVIDSQPPTITCPGPQSTGMDAGSCSFTQLGTAWDATATDNCTIVSSVYNLTGATSGSGSTTLQGVSFNKGVTTVNWTFTDSSGLTATCSYQVTVNDNQNPSVSCPADQTVNPDLGGCTYTITGTAWDAIGTDNCGLQNLTYTLSGATSGTGLTLNGVAFQLGTTTVNWTATDTDGLTGNCSFTVTVLDTQSPVLQGVPADITVSCDAVPAPAVVTAVDNCDVALTVVFSQTSTQTSNSTCTDHSYTIIRTWSVVDASLNATSQSQTITVQDITPPVLTLPPDISIAPGSPTLPANTGMATALDNCDPAPVITYSDSIVGTVCTGQTLTRTWSVVDVCGNATSGLQIITILPDAPVANQDDLTTNEDTLLTANLLADNGNGADAGVPALTVVAQTLSSPLGAHVTVAVDGTFTYDPTPSAYLQALAACEQVVETLAYTLVSGSGCTQNGTITVTVNGVNDLPTLNTAALRKITVFPNGLWSPLNGKPAMNSNVDLGDYWQPIVLPIEDVDSPLIFDPSVLSSCPPFDPLPAITVSAVSGTAQAATANSITLAATASSTNGQYNGLGITITGGTGSGQFRTITSYNGATKVAVVSSNWSTIPDATSTYQIGPNISGFKIRIDPPNIGPISPSNYDASRGFWTFNVLIPEGTTATSATVPLEISDGFGTITITYLLTIKPTPRFPIAREMPRYYAEGIAFKDFVTASPLSRNAASLPTTPITVNWWVAYSVYRETVNDLTFDNENWRAYFINYFGTENLDNDQVYWTPSRFFTNHTKELQTYILSDGDDNPGVEESRCFTGVAVRGGLSFYYYGHRDIDPLPTMDYSDWKVAAFGGNSGSPTADPDNDFNGDGVPNEVAYALGIDPLYNLAGVTVSPTANSNEWMIEGLPADILSPMTTILANGENWKQINYQRNPTAVGVTFALLYTEDNSLPNPVWSTALEGHSNVNNAHFGLHLYDQRVLVTDQPWQLFESWKVNGRVKDINNKVDELRVRFTYGPNTYLLVP